MSRIQTIHLFAAARDKIGSPTIQLTLSETATVTELRDKMMIDFPILATLLPISRIAINHDFVDDTTAIPVNAEIAVIPPVSGG